MGDGGNRSGEASVRHRRGLGREGASAKRRRGGLAKVSARFQLTVGEVSSEALVRHPPTPYVGVSWHAWLKAARLVQRAVI